MAGMRGIIMKHTPGPWQIKKWEEENSADGFVTVITDSRGHGIVTFNQRGENSKVEANARLIAMAPELLEAARALLDGLDSANHPDRNFKQVQDLRGAVIMATRKLPRWVY